MDLTAAEIAETFDRARAALDRLGVDAPAPRWNRSKLDDGSTNVEWIEPCFRIGFSLETNPAESSWWLVAGPCLDNLRACGLVEPLTLDGLAVLVLNFVALAYGEEE